MPKTARLEFRLEPEQKALIEKAARLSGASVSEFSAITLLEKARLVLAEHRQTEQILIGRKPSIALRKSSPGRLGWFPSFLRNFERRPGDRTTSQG